MNDASAQSTETRGNPLALASLTLGLVAVLVGWFPFVGLLAIPSGGLGLILGVAGFAVAMTGRRATLAAVGSAVGALLGLVAMTASITISWIVADAMVVADDAARQAPIPPMAIPQPLVDPARPVAPGLVLPPPTPLPLPHDPDPAPPEQRRPEVAARPALPMGQPFVLGDIEVRVVKAELGRVELRPRDPGRKARGPSESSGEFLSVYIEVKNTSGDRKIDYLTLAGPKVSLVDAIGNRYKPVDFGPSSLPRGRTGSASIYPSKAIDDLLVFEPPAGVASDLVLEIPAERARAGRVSFRFAIPAKSIAVRPNR